MKRVILISILSLFFVEIFAQAFNEQRMALSMWLTRKYENTMFEGAELFTQDDNFNEYEYLVSVVTLIKSTYQKESDMYRVAKIKALREAQEAVSSNALTTSTVVSTSETEVDGGAKTTSVTVETMERMRTAGFVQGMELLNTFSKKSDEMTFIYVRLIRTIPKPQAAPDSRKRRR